jgi:DNA-directed RNA polymerase specialized sigma24 family protein
MMGAAETDWEGLLEDWRIGRAGTAELYAALRSPMYRAARQGVASITSRIPDSADVEEAVFTAFTGLEKKDPNQVTSIVGLARRMAFRRGQDQGRAAMRRREQLEEALADPAFIEAAKVTEKEVALEAERERTFERAVACLDQLTGDQQDVIRATVMGRESLSDWAFRKDKTHQAASGQRDRALKALRRCIEQGDADEERR